MSKRNIPIFIVGVGADDKFKLIERIILKKSFFKVNKVYLRDYESINTINNLMGNSNYSNYIPDIVLSNYSFKNKVKGKKYLTVNIFSRNSYNNNMNLNLSKKDYYQLWINMIEEHKDNKNIILAYTSSTDKYETVEFKKYLDEFTEINAVIVDSDDLNNFTTILLQTDTLISGRMHGLLMGLNYQCKLIPFIVNKKLDTFTKEWVVDKNVNDYIDAKDKINYVITKILDTDIKKTHENKKSIL